MTTFFLALQSQTELKENPLVLKYASIILSVIVICFFVIIFFLWLYKLIEGIYVEFIGGKPLFRHFYPILKDLTPNQIKILETEFKFYKLLEKKEQRYFRHRVCKFLNRTEFIGKEHLQIEDTHRILVSATAIMLTFGYRNYSIRLVDRILIYPTIFYSNIDKNYHKGHFNPGFRAVIFSWEHFLEGYKIEDDNLNLGIHEFIHALHISYLNPKYKNDITAYLFTNGIQELKDFINSNSFYMNKIKTSNYIRDYAFENDFEFIAVIIETFIETPQEFKAQFPHIYIKVKQMLNFNFAGY